MFNTAPHLNTKHDCQGQQLAARVTNCASCSTPQIREEGAKQQWMKLSLTAARDVG